MSTRTIRTEILQMTDDPTPPPSSLVGSSCHAEVLLSSSGNRGSDLEEHYVLVKGDFRKYRNNSIKY